jgi:CheY-like chemotaxis protein
MDTAAPATPLPVLVVDDSRDTADFLALVLELWGYRPAVAYDGAAALRAARSGPFAAALIDLAMPGLNGYRLARCLRALPHWGGTVLIAATGYVHEEHRRRCREAGFHHHLPKPFHLLELRRLLPACSGA